MNACKSAVMNWYTMKTVITTNIAITGSGKSAKLIRYHCFHLDGNQCIIIPNVKSINTFQYPKQISGITSRFHADPI